MGNTRRRTNAYLGDWASLRPRKRTTVDDIPSSSQADESEDLPAVRYLPRTMPCPQIDDADALVRRSLEHEADEWLLQRVATPASDVVH